MKRKFLKIDRFNWHAAMMLFLLLWSIAAGADAQGLVGNELGCGRSRNQHPSPSFMIPDFGYDSLRDMTHVVTGAATAIAFVLALFVPFNKRKKATIGRVALELFGLALIPVLTHFAGTFILNNYGANSSGIF